MQMIDITKKPRKKRAPLWYGWKTEASKHFGVHGSTIYAWWNNSKPKLMDWVEEQMKIKEDARKRRDALYKKNTGMDTKSETD